MTNLQITSLSVRLRYRTWRTSLQTVYFQVYTLIAIYTNSIDYISIYRLENVSILIIFTFSGKSKY